MVWAFILSSENEIKTPCEETIDKVADYTTSVIFFVVGVIRGYLSANAVVITVAYIALISVLSMCPDLR